jgi:hypothetical protein
VLPCSLVVVEGGLVVFGMDAADQTPIAGGVLGELAAEGTAQRERLAVGVDVRRVSGVSG